VQELSYNNDKLEEEVAKEEIVVNKPPIAKSPERKPSDRPPLPRAARMDSAGQKRLGEELSTARPAEVARV